MDNLHVQGSRQGEYQQPVLLYYEPKKLNQKNDSLRLTRNGDYIEGQRPTLSDCSNKRIRLGENFKNNFPSKLILFPPAGSMGQLPHRDTFISSVRVSCRQAYVPLAFHRRITALDPFDKGIPLFYDMA